ncbi:MAG: hypothetical protein JNK15_22740 [Planctomycetes bacterium]|nr:hypothetical protein [Planctomycetota bacterium]
MRHLLPVLFPLLAAGTAAAQTIPNLIAPTLNNTLIDQSIHGTCTPLGNCGSLQPGTGTWFWAGGSAWDSTNTGVWISNGSSLARYGMNGCTLQCGPFLPPVLGWVTGMDMHDGNNRLWFIDSSGWIHEATNACPPVVVNSWNTGLPITGTTVTSAIAIDELRGLIFYTTCDFGFGNGWIRAAPLANPAAWFNVAPLFDCMPVPTLVTGLACDAANSALYWTNGRGTNRWTYNYNPTGPTIAYTPGTCCLQLAPMPDPYTDLSIRWGGATSAGGPCANGACAPCPNVHLLRNAPLLGTNLQLGLDLCQPATFALCGVDFGPCNTGVAFPPLCGPLMLPMTAAMLPMGPNIPAGPGPCAASTTWILPLPSNPSFVGTVMSSQCLSLCLPNGTSMSNCLTWVLQ